MRSTRWVVLFILLVLLVSACSGGDDMAGTAADADGTGQAAVEAEDEAAHSASGLAVGESREVTGEVEGGGDGDAQVGDDAAAEPEIEPLPDPPPAAPGDRVIKEGTVSIEVEEGGFHAAFREVAAKARTFQGDVVGTTTRTGDDGELFGSVTVRVPVRNFEDLLFGLGDIGTIQQSDVDSQDVSAEFTDLESRLRHLQAQERFYLGLFEDADSVQDAISIQQQLNSIQSQIEQIEGRVRLLDDRTTFSTLTVELFEPNAGASLLAEDEPAPGDRPSLARYWDTARDAFVNVVGAILVALLFAAPLIIVAGALVALWFVLRRRAVPGSERMQQPPAVEEPEREPVDAS